MEATYAARTAITTDVNRCTGDPDIRHMWIIDKKHFGGCGVKVFFPREIEMDSSSSLKSEISGTWYVPPESVIYGDVGLSHDRMLCNQREKVMSFFLTSIVLQFISIIFKINSKDFKGMWEMGDLAFWVWLEIYFKGAGMNHKTLLPWWPWFIGLCKRIRTGQVTMRMVEVILMNSQLIPSPEIKIPPMTRDGDLQFSFQHVEANAWEYYRGVTIQNAMILLECMNLGTNCMSHNYLCTLMSKYWFDFLELCFQYTDWALRVKGDAGFDWDTCVPGEDWVRNLIDVGM